MFQYKLYFFLFMIFATQNPTKGQTIVPPFDSVPEPLAPDYSIVRNWAVHPYKNTLADKIPFPLRKQKTNLADTVDVFFVHPTIYTDSPENQYLWNAAIDDCKMNEKVDKSTIKLQASIFNQAGRVFSPRYRQAHLRSFFQPNIEEGNKALDLAYKDIKAAFLYYMENENGGRPIIFAGHSQGARHIKQLLQELVDGQPLQEKLVAAYIVGWGCGKETFKNIPLGESPKQVGCFLTWRTYNEGFIPSWVDPNDVCVNPLTWKTDTLVAPYQMNEGSVIFGFNSVSKKIFNAKVAGPVLWVSKPNVLFGKMFVRQNYHVGDFNIFYVNVRRNAILRARTYIAAQTAQ